MDYGHLFSERRYIYPPLEGLRKAPFAVRNEAPAVRVSLRVHGWLKFLGKNVKKCLKIRFHKETFILFRELENEHRCRRNPGVHTTL
jgi:hypothetical protein